MQTDIVARDYRGDMLHSHTDRAASPTCQLVGPERGQCVHKLIYNQTKQRRGKWRTEAETNSEPPHGPPQCWAAAAALDCQPERRRRCAKAARWPRAPRGSVRPQLPRRLQAGAGWVEARGPAAAAEEGERRDVGRVMGEMTRDGSDEARWEAEAGGGEGGRGWGAFGISAGGGAACGVAGDSNAASMTGGVSAVLTETGF